MADTLPTPLLSSVEGGQAAPDGSILLPRFWDEAMARYGARPSPGWLWVTESVEWLMRHMGRDPVVWATDRVYAALICEGKHEILGRYAKPANGHGNSKAQQDYRKSDKAREFTQRWADAMPRKLPRVVRQLCEAKAYGHKLCEIEWTIAAGGVVPIDLAPKPRIAYRLRVDRSNRLLGVVPNGADQDALVPASSVLIVSMHGMDDDPTGTPVRSVQYKAWLRKEADLKNQGMSTRQAGGGSLVVEQEYPAAGTPWVGTIPVTQRDGTVKNEPSIDVAAKAASRIRTGSVAVGAPGQRFKFLQADGAAIFEAPLDRDDKEIVMAMLGQYRTLLSSDTNSQADSGVAEGVMLTLRDEDRGVVCGVLDQLFEDVVVANLGEAYRAYAPRYSISTEETRDLAAIGLFLSGNWANLTLDQKNQLMAWIGLSEFPEDDQDEDPGKPQPSDEQDEEGIDAKDSEDAQSDVARFMDESAIARGEDPDGPTFATRVEIANGAAQRRVGGKSGLVPSSNRQFRSLVTRLHGGKLTEDEFVDRFGKVLARQHERAYGVGFAHGGGAKELSPAGKEYVAATVASEGAYARDMAADLADGTISRAEGLRRATLYSNRVRGTANAGFREASEALGLTLTWTLGANEDHCADCPRYAAMSPWQADELPTTPGEGDTDCVSNCTCGLTREDGREGFSRASTRTTEPETT